MIGPLRSFPPPCLRRSQYTLYFLYTYVHSLTHIGRVVGAGKASARKGAIHGHGQRQLTADTLSNRTPRPTQTPSTRTHHVCDTRNCPTYHASAPCNTHSLQPHCTRALSLLAWILHASARMRSTHLPEPPSPHTSPGGESEWTARGRGTCARGVTATRSHAPAPPSPPLSRYRYR